MPALQRPGCLRVAQLKLQLLTDCREEFIYPSLDGDVAQLGERSLRKAEVTGSIPVISTIASLNSR